MASPAALGAATVGVYVHVPFCGARCSYCDFPIVVGRDDLAERYVDALVLEIDRRFPDDGPRADTVYFGGGTPSRLGPATLARVVDHVRARFDVAPDAEVSLEANPEDLDADRIEGLRAAGVNRVTIGVQSLDDRVLRSVGRVHGGERALEAVAAARSAGFETVGADLIGGLPHEPGDAAGRTIEALCGADPDHVSFYLLELDHDTPLSRAVRAGRAHPADDDRQADAYGLTAARLIEAGYEHYEISNFARPGHRSRHNGKYWADEPYVGFGCGAHGYLEGERRWNVRGIEEYLESVEAGGDPVAGRDPRDPIRRLEEALFLGLRRAEGVDPRALGDRYGIDVAAAYGPVWERLRREGAIEADGSRVRLSPSTRVRSNHVFREVLGVLTPAPD